MACPGHSGNVADDAEPRTELVIEGKIVQIDVILHLIVQDGATHLVIRSNVVRIRAVSAESDAYRQIVKSVCPVASMKGLLLICRVQTRNQRLFRMRRDAALSKSHG